MLFARTGYDAVNSNQIARQAGVGVGTFYRHFVDKQALADALRLQVWEQLGLHMPPWDEASPARFGRAATEAIVDFAVAHPEPFRAAFGGMRTAKMQLSLRPIERRFRELIEAGAAREGLEPAVAARAWWSMISGTVVWWLEDPSRTTRQELVDTLAALHPASG